AQHRDRPAVDVEPAELQPALVPGSGHDLAEEGVAVGIGGERGPFFALPPGLLQREEGVAPGAELGAIVEDARVDRAQVGEAVAKPAQLLALLLPHRLLVISGGREAALKEGPDPAVDDD